VTWIGFEEAALGFIDRADAGRHLAERLRAYAGPDVVVLGLPRGGVPVACEVAGALGAPLDVIIVRKLGVPFQPELAMGAIGEGGARTINDEVVRAAQVTSDEMAAVEAAERRELERRAERFRSERVRIDLSGRTALIVDDGIATGSTARAACQVARAQGATRVILAVPVAPVGARERFAADVDEFVVLATPEPFHAVGQFYADFSQVSDEEVMDLLARSAGRPDAAPGDATGAGAGAGDDPPIRSDDVDVSTDAVTLAGHLEIPEQPIGIVLFAHGSGSSRHSSRNRYVASVLNAAGIGTLLFDLLTSEEETERSNVFDVELLARRLIGATNWLRGEPGAGQLPIGYFGASTGAAAALWAAGEPGGRIAAVVSRGGRPDLAGAHLGMVVAPTLLIVGSRDGVVLDLNRAAASQMRGETEIAIIPGATHLFEEPGTLHEAAVAARDWFTRQLPRGAPLTTPASS
jgi:predicted phosphoribosyltransferase/predicted alpha/beta-hydrolase family hydrolase